MVHQPVPDNHKFSYYGNSTANADFSKRIELYRGFASEYTETAPFPATAAQIIAILSADADHFALVKEGLSDYQVIRTTSPLDSETPVRVTVVSTGRWSKSVGRGSTWMEMRPSGSCRNEATALPPEVPDSTASFSASAAPLSLTTASGYGDVWRASVASRVSAPAARWIYFSNGARVSHGPVSPSPVPA